MPKFLDLIPCDKENCATKAEVPGARANATDLLLPQVL